MSCLSKDPLEVCVHDDGEVHIFLFARACEGKHVKLHQTGDIDYLHRHESCSGHHDKSDVHDDEHHEPCEHEFITFDDEWIARVINCITIDILQKSPLSSYELTETGSCPVALAARSFAPRAPPPWRSDANDYFLKTTRLLI